MPILLAPQLIRAMKAFGIDYAALFDGSTGYMTFTPVSAGDAQTWTFSAWVMRTVETSRDCILSAYVNGTQKAGFWFQNTDALEFYDVWGNPWQSSRVTNALYRDLGAFYHLVVVSDISNATAQSRARVYVNGDEITSFSINANPADTHQSHINDAYEHTLGRFHDGTYVLDGALADVYFVDGQVLAPSDFGKTDSRTGNWVPKKRNPSAFDLGTNGFYLDFADANDLGKSGPRAANVSAVFDPLHKASSTYPRTIQNGNREVYRGASGSDSAYSTLSADASDDTFVEFYINVIGFSRVGLCAIDEIPNATENLLGSSANSWAYNYSGTLRNNGVGSGGWGDTFTTGDYIGVRLNAGSLYFYKNGVVQNGGNPAATGITGRFVFGATVDSGGMVTIVANPDEMTHKIAASNYLTTNNLPAVNASPVTEHFNTVLYTGNSPSNNAVTGVGFQPDFVWIKCRNLTRSNAIFDDIRGVGNPLSPNSTAAEPYDPNVDLVSFDSDGFTTDDSGDVNDGTPGTYVAWCARLPNTKTSGWSGSPTITPTKEIYNAELGMSIVTYTGNGTAGATIPHSLGQKPGMVIVKKRVANGGDGARSWPVYHSALGATKTLYLNLNNTSYTYTPSWNDTEPTSTSITFGTNPEMNYNGDDYVAYIFTATDYIKIGSYEGNGSTDGPMINAGVSPVWVLEKGVDSAGNWWVKDTVRSPYNPGDETLYPNLSHAENTGAVYNHDIVANGVKHRANNEVNSNGNTHIYMMIGEPAKRAALEGQNWQTHGGVTQVTSTPTNVTCTLNALDKHASVTLTNGNKSYSCPSSGSSYFNCYSIFAVPANDSDGWRVQIAMGSGHTNNASKFGFSTLDAKHADNGWNDDTDTTPGFYNFYDHTTNTDIGYSNGDGSRVTVDGSDDMDSGDIYDVVIKSRRVYLYKNGSLLYSSTSDTVDEDLIFYLSGYGSGSIDYMTVAFAEDEWIHTLIGAGSTAKAINTDNLQNQPGNIDDHFKTVLWTGDGTSSNAVTGVGYQPDFVWIKNRDVATGHAVFDVVRGAQKRLRTDGVNAESTEVNGLTSFDADGFTVGSDSFCNSLNTDYTAWCANLPNTKTSGWSGSPTITPSKEIYNPELGVSIVTYTGNGTAGATIPHSLGKKPGMIIIKKTHQNGADGARSWAVYHSSLGVTGATSGLVLNQTSAAYDASLQWNSTEPTSTLITLGGAPSSYHEVNYNGDGYIAYIFAETEFCKIGSYTGNGNADGPFINLGGSPVWCMFKGGTNGTGTYSWQINDNTRTSYNQIDDYLTANGSNAEITDSTHGVDFLANGIKVRGTNGDVNTSSGLVYIAFVQPNGKRENPAR